MTHVSHWDDAETDTADVGPIGGTWTALGEAVGCQRLGANRFRIPAGKAATPLHAEDEEVIFVLAGSGWSVEEPADPPGPTASDRHETRTYAIGAGDVVHYPAWRPAHTVVAGDDGIDLIAFGTTDGPRGTVRFPRIDKVLLARHLLAGDHTHQWELEARLPRIEVAEPPDPRPATIVNLEDVEEITWGQTTARFLTRRVGARGIALNWARLGANAEGAPLHCHSLEEELFVVLDGDGALLLGNDEEEHPVRAGSLVGRPPGTGVAHGFRAGEQGMTLLMFSDKHPNDMTYYPRSGKVSLRGLGITIQPEIVPWG